MEVFLNLVIGGIAGGGATMFSNPMDVVKTRMQLQGELHAQGEYRVMYKNVFHGLYVIAKNDGVLALQKGLAPALILGTGLNSIRLSVYRTAERRGYTKKSNGEGSVVRMCLWGGLGGATGAFVFSPINLVKTRLQSAAHHSIAVGAQHRYKGLLDGLSHIYKTEGIRGCFAGANGYCWRLGIGSAAQLTTFSSAKEAILKTGFLQNSRVLLPFAASCVSGVLIVCCVCPLDVASVRLFNQDRKKQLYTGLLDCLIKIFQTEGLFGLYKGAGPLYCRLAPHTTVSLVLWDVLSSIK